MIGLFMSLFIYSYPIDFIDYNYIYTTIQIYTIQNKFYTNFIKKKMNRDGKIT